MTVENLIISIILFSLFFFMIMPMVYGFAKIIVEMKMKNQMWNSITTLASRVMGNNPQNSLNSYTDTSYKTQNNSISYNTLLIIMLLVFVSLMYLDSNRGSPEQSDTEKKEKFEYNKQVLASFAGRLNVPKGGQQKTKKSSNYQKEEKSSLEKKSKTSIYDVRIDGVIKEQPSSLDVSEEKTQQLTDELEPVIVEEEPVIIEKRPLKKEVFTVQYSANSIRDYAENNKEKLDEKYSNHWTYLYEDFSDSKVKVFIGQFENEEAAIKFSRKLDRKTKVIEIKVTIP